MSQPTEVRIRLLPHYPAAADLPRQMTASAAGFDLMAAIKAPMTLLPHKRLLVPCGFQLQLPAGYEAQVRPRSGLAAKHGLTCLNSPGTIDADYRGEVCVLLIHHGEQPYVIEPASRIAQLVVAKVPTIAFVEAASLETSGRGERGFGHTGS